MKQLNKKMPTTCKNCKNFLKTSLIGFNEKDIYLKNPKFIFLCIYLKEWREPNDEINNQCSNNFKKRG